MMKVAVSSSGVQCVTSHLARLFTVKVLSHSHKLSVHRVLGVFFFITFYCVAFKVAI